MVRTASIVLVLVTLLAHPIAVSAQETSPACGHQAAVGDPTIVATAGTVQAWPPAAPYTPPMRCGTMVAFECGNQRGSSTLEQLWDGFCDLWARVFGN